MDIAFPFHIDGRGRTAQAETEPHVRQLVEQLLFTVPGERVNRPEFGTPLMQMLFAPASPELGTATEAMVQGALQQWLGELIEVDGVEVQVQDTRVKVVVEYRLRRTQTPQIAELSREI